MTTSASAPFPWTNPAITPGQSPEPLLPPDPAQLFRRRADRLRQLADGNSLRDWLLFVADVSDGQREVAALPADAPPEGRWRADLEALYPRLRPHLPAAAIGAVEDVLGQDPGTLTALANRLHNGAPTPADLPAAPLVMAALQLAWTRHAAHIAPSIARPESTMTTCPVCGSAPVAGVIHIGMQSGGLRYLHCGLCHTAWHHVRATCVACGDGKKVTQRFIEGDSGVARAETCDSCKSYLKLLHADKAQGLDPVADDLASLALDLLVGEEGYRRMGANPFLLQAI
ncbi:formate dehydrogenase accessory protein FdhE [Telmatospirillum siberiense]|uniref:Formate dehydrogenase accessory protein FdhE n=1 Tax=Telmatospirillum siberiense TaxID=382514 RepID=A0A2N3PWB6_9PROT|nr:formate dehydrogenase accessory protein FdhE [Telmatospirillum siberiense]PKU24696.1 formate dehydrogenase accessory protein FdhE [Telmatospirillum siberiense]